MTSVHGLITQNVFLSVAFAAKPHITLLYYQNPTQRPVANFCRGRHHY